MSTILAIDPGNVESAYCYLDDGLPITFAKVANNVMLGVLEGIEADSLAIEYMKPRGMPTSKEEMDTQFWAGRFVQAWGGDWTPIHRADVKMNICGHIRAKDSNIRQALIDRFPAKGGGKCPQVGTKKKPGPLYGMSGDCWSALAVGLTYYDTLTAKSA